MDNGMEKMSTGDVLESQRMFNVAVWIERVKVSDRAQDRGEWRG